MSGTVLIRTGALGDVVLLGAVTGHVQGPVTVVTRPEWCDVARRLSGVARVVAWEKGTPASRIATHLPQGRWIDLQGSREVGQLIRHGRGPVARIDKRSIRRRLRLWFGVGTPRPSVAELYAEACDVWARPVPWIDCARRPSGELVLVPGAAWATKRWGCEGFVTVGRSWAGPVRVVGGPEPDERALCDEIADQIPGAHGVNERGFHRVCAAFARASVVVAGDTGLMHLAGACGVPVVALFGPTHPSDGFFVYPGEIVQRPLACRPCTLHRQPHCPIGDHACMDLDMALVVEAVRRCSGRDAG